MASTGAETCARTRCDPDATIIYALVALLGLGRLAAVWGLHEAFGWEATVALVFAIAGVVGLAGLLLRR
jgi:hypothetical protein